MIRRAALKVSAVALAGAAAAISALLLTRATVDAAETRRAASPAAIELQPSRRSDLDTIEIEIADPRQTRSPRRAVTDLLVVLLPGRTPLDRALVQPGGRGPAAERRLYRARLTAVSGGRLHRGPSAWCSGFDGDLSVCDVDCDGGRFSLRRGSMADEGFALIVGPGAGDDATGSEGGGISLSACHLDGGGETRLVARRGAVADIALSAD